MGEDEIAAVLRDQVIKRDALEGPEAETAARRVQRRSDRSILNSKEDRPEAPPAAAASPA